MIQSYGFPPDNEIKALERGFAWGFWFALGLAMFGYLVVR